MFCSACDKVEKLFILRNNDTYGPYGRTSSIYLVNFIFIICSRKGFLLFSLCFSVLNCLHYLTEYTEKENCCQILEQDFFLFSGNNDGGRMVLNQTFTIGIIFQLVLVSQCIVCLYIFFSRWSLETCKWQSEYFSPCWECDQSSTLTR